MFFSTASFQPLDFMPFPEKEKNVSGEERKKKKILPKNQGREKENCREREREREKEKGREKTKG